MPAVHEARERAPVKLSRTHPSRSSLYGVPIRPDFLQAPPSCVHSTRSERP
jgi:hypothetical protein